MFVLDKARAGAEADAADVADRTMRCSCLPFCFWRGFRSRRMETEVAPGKQQHPRRRRRFRFIRLSWLAFSWPWQLRKKQGGKKDAGQQRRGRRLLLLLKTSMQAKKALAFVVVSGDSGGLLPGTVSSFGDAKKQSRSRPRPIADGAAPSSTRSQLQASTTARGTIRSTAPGRTVPNQSRTTTTDEPALMSAGRIWRAPSRRHSLGQPDGAERPTGLWTAATTLGVIVLFGRVTAVVFLCSYLYGARFIQARAAGDSVKNSSVAGASSSRRFGEPIGVAGEKITEECKKKVVMAGLLERTGKRPSSRFGR